jgi:hypothetical protein
MSGRFSFFALCAAVSFAGLSATAVVAAQQAAVDSGPATAPSAAADPAPVNDLQSSATPAQSSVTNASAAQTAPPQGAPQGTSDKQTKRILGIVPNFRAVSADEELPPETIKEKFMDATHDSFDYSSIVFPIIIAGYNQGRNATPEFHQGAAGYARYFWHSAVDQSSENYMVEFIFPTITLEDARYYTLGHGGFMKRTGYALSRAVITRTNSGAKSFNFSEIVGAGAAAGISNLYYPSASRTLGNTGSQWGLDVGIDAGVFWFREFWPDINRRLFHNKYADAPPGK